ncbi:hypothetical protein BGZ81_002291 [Podila clonocystis]|nr:hypothetical protein BGZ81_002291 [Podila clonocystis]
MQEGFMALALAAALLYGQTEAQSMQATLNMNGVHVYFKFTPLGPGIPGAHVEISGTIKTQALKPNIGFEYHVHEKPVGPNSNCMATGGHLNPCKFGDDHCNPVTLEKCQEGDLSGKHVNLKPSAVPLGAITYVDRYLQWENTATTIVRRSVVVHNNGTCNACGDLLPVGSVSHGVTSAPIVALETNDGDEDEDDDDVGRQMAQSGESDEFSRAAALTGRHNGANPSLDERIVLWTLVTSVAAGVVAALMAL